MSDTVFMNCTDLDCGASVNFAVRLKQQSRVVQVHMSVYAAGFVISKLISS
jgi:hypothetical protein